MAGLRPVAGKMPAFPGGASSTLGQNENCWKLAEIIVTPDGAVLGRPEGAPTANVFIGAEADLRANLRRLGMAAGLDESEWALLAEVTSRRLGMRIEKEGNTSNISP